jgi:carboxymethylenebutenolidase
MVAFSKKRPEAMMAINGSWIHYADQSGYFAYPEHTSEPLPAILVIQEVWGVNAHIQDVTRRFAAAGYAALAPDLLAVDGKRPEALSQERILQAMSFIRTIPPAAWRNPEARDAELARIDEPDRSRIGETCSRLFAHIDHLSAYIPSLRKAVHHLRDQQPQTRHQKVACVGFCMGGGLSALLACEEPELSGAAIFYGVTPPEEKIPSIKCPVIGFYGANDLKINPGIPVFEKGLRDLGKTYENHIYEGASHSFFNDDGQAYHVKAVRDSFVRLVSFFYKTLSA